MTNHTPPRNLVILVSGAGTTMQAILEATRDPAYGARVAGVIADRPGIAALDIAEAAGVPTAVVSLTDFPDRATWDEALARTMGSFTPDLVVHAGFMKIVGAPSLERFGGRMVNTHPALLPSFPGAHGVRDALAAGVKVTGCSVIIIDEGVDTGPIVAQAAVEVRDNDSESSLHERIKTVERDLVVHTVGTMVREGWTVDGRVVRLGSTKGN
ncbi:MAG: phosphoribosylglycinamide formyltransferase [Actinobacteria bacterium HGW-Actinobacteria-4]|nr:MAG: phosphoribosylglycinamide formyltransferase [Actinobacteria bacterium HGW-Actinobacteria-4]